MAGPETKDSIGQAKSVLGYRLFLQGSMFRRDRKGLIISIAENN